MLCTGVVNRAGMVYRDARIAMHLTSVSEVKAIGRNPTNTPAMALLALNFLKSYSAKASIGRPSRSPDVEFPSPHGSPCGLFAFRSPWPYPPISTVIPLIT
jgi:hypothetical protein